MKTNPFHSANFTNRRVALTCAVIACVLLNVGARAAALLEEVFDYSSSTTLSANGYSSGTAITVAAGNLIYPGLAAPMFPGNMASYPSGTAGTSYRNLAPAVSAGSVYISFLIKMTTIPSSTSGSMIAGLTVGTGGPGSISSGVNATEPLQVYVKQITSTTYQIGIRKLASTITFSSTTVNLDDTVLVVVKYTFNTGNSTDDTVSLWVNATSLGGSEAGADVSVGSGQADLAAVSGVFLRSDSSSRAGALNMDNLRLGDSWADVTSLAPQSSSDVVIAEVYGSGGNSGATYLNDFVVLYNRGCSSVSINGWSLQYQAQSGTAWTVINLANATLLPGSFHLVQLGSGGANGSALPTPDTTGSLNISGSQGKMALVNSTTTLSSGCPSSSSIMDKVAFGSTSAVCNEGGMNTFGAAAATSCLRRGGGWCDTDNNGSDFVLGTPNPRNSSTTVSLGVTAPTANTATGVGDAGFNANWTAGGGSPGPSGYRLDVATDGDFSSFVSGYNNLDVSNVTTYAVTGLAGGTEYHYRVRAYNAVCTSDSSSTISATTSGGCTKPTITLVANPTVCSGVTSVNLTYSATTESPDQYSIDFNAAAEGEGFVDVTLASLPSSPIIITVPGGAASGTYNATLTVRNSGADCTGDPYNISVTVNPNPTITLGTSPTVCSGTTSANLPYSGTSDSPDQYRVDFDGAAEGEGFSDVSLTPLGSSPIVITVPGGASADTYNGNLYVKNSTTGCESAATPFTVTITETPAAPSPSASGGSGKVTLTWSAVSGATSYSIFRATTSGGQGAATYTGVTGTSYDDTAVDPDTTYYYKMTAVAGCESTQSSETSATTLSTSSDIIADTGFTYPEDIAYGSYQETDLTASSLEVAQFVIRDGGLGADADSADTTLTDLSFSVANSANLRRVALYDGTTELGEVAADSTVTFTSLSLTAADGGTKTFTVRASFQSTVTDNQQFSFTVSTATAGASGSGFGSGNGGGAASSTDGDDNRIEVTASKLVFSSVPSSVTVNEDFGVTVQALDANENLDLDNTASVALSKASGSGTLSSTVGLSQSLSSGAYSWSDVQIDTAGTFTLQAVDNGSALTTATSGNITVVTIPQYRSRQNGDWGDFNTWQVDYGSGFVDAVSGENPTSADDTIEIRSPHTVTVTASVTIDQTTIQAGATVIIATGQQLTVANGDGTDLDVLGTLQSNASGTSVPTPGGATIVFGSTGVYNNNVNGGTAPTATWSDGSLFLITGGTTSLPNMGGQSFYDVTVNESLSQAANLNGNLTTVRNNLLIQNSGGFEVRLFSSTGGTVSVGGNITVNSGQSLGISSASANPSTVNIGGNLAVAGTLTVSGSYGVSVNFNGAGSQTFSVATLNNANRYAWKVNSGSTLMMNSALTVSAIGAATVGGSFTVDGTLNCGANVISGTGIFTVSSGATLAVGSTGGIASSGATGNIQTTTRSFNSGANYIYDGEAAQVTGTGLPATVNDLTIENTAAEVSLTANVAVDGTLTVDSGANLNFDSKTVTCASAPSLAGELTMQVNKTAPNTFTGAKLTQTAGTLTYGGTVTVTASGNALAGGDSIPLFASSGGFGGGFTTVTGPTVPAGLTRDITQLTGGTGGNIDLISVNSDPVAGTDTYNRTAGLQLMIAIADLLTNDDDADDDTLSYTGLLSLTTTNGTTLITNNTFILYTNSVSPNVNDRFFYTISDGNGGSATGIVDIVVVTELYGTNSITKIQHNVPEAGKMTITFAGIPGVEYTLQRNTNLAVGAGWVDIYTEDTGGVMVHVDDFPDIANPPPGEAYYRLKYQTP